MTNSLSHSVRGNLPDSATAASGVGFTANYAKPRELGLSVGISY